MFSCRLCHQDKPVTDFPFVVSRKKPRGRQEDCRICIRKKKGRKYFVENRQKVKLYRLQKIEKHRQYINTLKKEPCMDCKGTFPPYVMQYDHLRDKSFSIAYALARCRSLKTILKEIEKCELVCANCHAVRTWTRTHVNPS